MISICRKLSRGWNQFELMISICRKLSRGRNQKKKVPALAQLFQPPRPTSCNPCLTYVIQHVCRRKASGYQVAVFNTWFLSTRCQYVHWKFAMSNFDPNAIIRGAQLTIVGGLRSVILPLHFPSWNPHQRSEHSRTQAYSNTSITARLLLPSALALS